MLGIEPNGEVEIMRPVSDAVKPPEGCVEGPRFRVTTLAMSGHIRLSRERMNATSSQACSSDRLRHDGIAVPRTPSRIAKKIRRFEVLCCQARSVKSLGLVESEETRTPWPSPAAPWQCAQYRENVIAPLTRAVPDAMVSRGTAMSR